MYVKTVNTRVRLWLYYYGCIVFPCDSENNSPTDLPRTLIGFISFINHVLVHTEWSEGLQSTCIII